MRVKEFASISSVVGIGTDILDSKRIKKAYERYQIRLVKRILTANEIALWEQRGRCVNFLAKQFAAKEAISKALGTGLSQGVSLQQLEILRNEQGAPVARVSAKAYEIMQKRQGNQLHLSLSDEGDLILAFALISH